MIQTMDKKADHLDQHPEMTLMEHQGLPGKQQPEFNPNASGYLKRADSGSSMPVHSDSYISLDTNQCWGEKTD